MDEQDKVQQGDQPAAVSLASGVVALTFVLLPMLVGLDQPPYWQIFGILALALLSANIVTAFRALPDRRAWPALALGVLGAVSLSYYASHPGSPAPAWTDIVANNVTNGS